MKNLLYIMMLGFVSTVVHAKWVEVKPSDGKVLLNLEQIHVFDKDTIYARRDDVKDMLYKWDKGRWESLGVHIPEEATDVLLHDFRRYSVLSDGTLYVLGDNENGKATIYKGGKKWTPVGSIDKETDQFPIVNFFAANHDDFFIIRGPNLFQVSLFRGDGKQWKQIELGDIAWGYPITSADKKVWFEGYSKKDGKMYIVALSRDGTWERINMGSFAMRASFGVQNKENIWTIGGDDHKAYHFNGKTGVFTLKDGNVAEFISISVGKDGTVWGLALRAEGPEDVYPVVWQE